MGHLAATLTIEHHAHKRFPERLAFTLYNPIRRIREPPERLISRLEIGSNDVVVDFGCGPGFFLIPLARVAGKAIGVDALPSMLERAARNAEKNGVAVQLLRSDGVSVGLESQSVDLILLNHVFHEVGEKPRVLREFHRILKHSGRLVIVERTREPEGRLHFMGPPIIDENEIVREVERSGFRFAGTIELDGDSIVISRRVE
jgi:ubiquinone/menaquinone biosynthesis C-methylase UbiE